MAQKLDALLGVIKTVKQNAQRAIDEFYKEVQKRPLFDGLSRTYQARADEDGDQLPPEGVLVQYDAENMLRNVLKEWTRMLDLSATIDSTNTRAFAPVKVGDDLLTEPLPAQHLVFLEKQLVDLQTYIKHLPVQDPAKAWTWDPEKELFTSGPVKTLKSKKVPRNHVRFEGNDKHPPQIDVYNEDVTVGEWSKMDYTTAISPRRKRELADRVEQLISAVRVARSEANQAEATDVSYAADLFSYVLEG